MVAIGRNDICFCRSGKKYKVCCLTKNAKQMESSQYDLEWVKLREAEGGIEEKLTKYISNRFESAFYKVA